MSRDDEADADAERAPDAPTLGFISAGIACDRLYADTPARLSDARSHVAFYCALAKWTVAFACGLVGWLCLTAPGAPPTLTPLWPAVVITLGSYMLASAAVSVPEAAVEAVLQSYCEVSHPPPHAMPQRRPCPDRRGREHGSDSG